MAANSMRRATLRMRPAAESSRALDNVRANPGTAAASVPMCDALGAMLATAPDSRGSRMSYNSSRMRCTTPAKPRGPGRFQSKGCASAVPTTVIAPKSRARAGAAIVRQVVARRKVFTIDSSAGQDRDLAGARQGRRPEAVPVETARDRGAGVVGAVPLHSVLFSGFVVVLRTLTRLPVTSRTLDGPDLAMRQSEDDASPWVNRVRGAKCQHPRRRAGLPTATGPEADPDWRLTEARCCR